MWSILRALTPLQSDRQTHSDSGPVQPMTGQPPKPNLPFPQRKELHSLKNDTNIVIIPADKGTATVIMDRYDYTHRMLQDSKNRIAFLDVQVTRANNRLTISVFRKPTHMDRYISFHSHHHQRTVTGVLRCLRDRANRICAPTSKQQKFQHLQAVFQANDFPAELVSKMLSHHTHPPCLILCMRVQQNHRRSCAYSTSVASVKKLKEYAPHLG